MIASKTYYYRTPSSIFCVCMCLFSVCEALNTIENGFITIIMHASRFLLPIDCARVLKGSKTTLTYTHTMTTKIRFWSRRLWTITRVMRSMRFIEPFTVSSVIVHYLLPLSMVLSPCPQALQVSMQGVLESLVLLDRLVCVREWGVKGELVPVFDERISPRNMAMILYPWGVGNYLHAS